MTSHPPLHGACLEIFSENLIRAKRINRETTSVTKPLRALKEEITTKVCCLIEPDYGRVSRRCMLNFAASPLNTSGCAAYFGVIRLENTACCVSKLARSDGRKNLHPHSTHRNGRTNAAVSSVRSSTPFLRDRRTHTLRQAGQRGEGKLIDTTKLPQGLSANDSDNRS
jgi:hypothetical protein